MEADTGLLKSRNFLMGREREREWVERNAIKKWEGMKHIAQDNLRI